MLALRNSDIDLNCTVILKNMLFSALVKNPLFFFPSNAIMPKKIEFLNFEFLAFDMSAAGILYLYSNIRILAYAWVLYLCV